MASLPSYDNTKVQSLSLSQDQVGESSSPTVWNDITLPHTSGFHIGFSFDFSITRESEQNLALAPRIPFTAATSDLAGTGETSNTWTLTFGTTETEPPLAVRTLYGVVSAELDPWSDSNTMVTALATTGATYLIEAIAASSATWVQDETTLLYSMVWNFDFLTNYTETVTGTPVLNPMHSIVNDPNWNGLMQFILAPVGNFTITSLGFAGNTHKWHTGQIGAPMRQRGRVVHDYITGQPYMSNEAVPDGYRDGIMVHPDNFDPTDPNDTDFFTPPPGEGVVDDEVDNLE